MKRIDFNIPCVPPRATAQQKGVSVRNGKVMFYKKPRIKCAEDKWIALLRPYAPKEPFAGPVNLIIGICFPWRIIEAKKNKKTGMLFNDVRPDLDNILKMVLDAMTELQFWKDDSQVALLTASKMWSSQPGLVGSVNEL